MFFLLCVLAKRAALTAVASAVPKRATSLRDANGAGIAQQRVQ
jgi:hypothetical protein